MTYSRIKKAIATTPDRIKNDLGSTGKQLRELLTDFMEEALFHFEAYSPGCVTVGYGGNGIYGREISLRFYWIHRQSNADHLSWRHTLEVVMQNPAYEPVKDLLLFGRAVTQAEHAEDISIIVPIAQTSQAAKAFHYYAAHSSAPTDLAVCEPLPGEQT